jgi:hypothetical protein
MYPAAALLKDKDTGDNLMHTAVLFKSPVPAIIELLHSTALSICESETRRVAYLCTTSSGGLMSLRAFEDNKETGVSFVRFALRHYPRKHSEE